MPTLQSAEGENRFHGFSRDPESKEIQVLCRAIPSLGQQVEQNPTLQDQLISETALGHPGEESLQDKKNLGVLDALAVQAFVAQALEDAVWAFGVAFYFLCD